MDDFKNQVITISYSEEDHCYVAKINQPENNLCISAHGNSHMEVLNHLQDAYELHQGNQLLPVSRTLEHSMCNFVKEFCNFLLKNQIVDNQFEFGSWDHFWLSSFIAFYIQNFSENHDGVIGLFTPPLNTICDEDWSIRFTSAKHLEIKKLNELSQMFLNIMEDENQETVDRALDKLKEYYLYLWR